MLVLKILGCFTLIVGIFTSFILINKHCEEKFSYCFLTTPIFLATVIAMALLLLGNLWREDALKTGNDALNVIILMSIGVLIIIFLVYINFKQTNFWYGVGGTLLQSLAFGIPTYVGYPFLIFCTVLWFFAKMGEARYIRTY